MRLFRFLFLATVLIVGLTVAAPQMAAEVGVSVEIGSAPVCPYGYYPTAPYTCAPYGYYGPEWFDNGVFIGVGPWWHGDEHFRGHVDRDFDEDHFRGHRPERGEHADWDRHHFDDFHGSVTVDGRGREMRERER